MAKNYIFTMKVSTPNFRLMLKEVQGRIGAKDYEETIVKLVRKLFPDIAMRHYARKIEVIRVWDSTK